MIRRMAPWLGLVIVIFCLVPVAAAQQPTPSDDQVNAIAKRLYCPVCENVPLDVCPTQACAQWRATIREKLAAGWSDQQIMDYFVNQYGERVLAQPSARGLNVLVWVLPPVLALAGFAFYFYYVRRLVAPARPVAARAGDRRVDPAVEDDYAARLERELKERR